MGVLASFGFKPPLRRILVSTGAATAVSAPFGGHAVNLAAIVAAMTAGPDADPDPDRRWIASVAMGGAYLALGLVSGIATTLLVVVPQVLIEAVAGLALLGALAGAIAAAMNDATHREAATATLVVSASSVTAAGISAPFWGLCAGLALLGLARLRRPDPVAAATLHGRT
jgi:benzoate membrane transport protein